MKSFQTTLFLVLGLLLGCAFNLAAQSRPEKTSSARAYYGTSPQKQNFKMKKKSKSTKYKQPKPAKGTNTFAKPTANRRKHAG